MAAPSEVSMQNLTGYWTLSKPLSGAFDPVFAIQGIPWVLRKVISLATLSLKASHEVDESGAKVLVLTQIVSVAIAGLSEEKEVRVLDGREKFHSSALFGTSSAQSRMISLSTATGHDGKPFDPLLIQDFVNEGESGEENLLYDLIIHQTNGWVMEQIWGFGMVNNERRLIRTLGIKKGDKVAYTRAIYDWMGEDGKDGK